MVYVLDRSVLRAVTCYLQARWAEEWAMRGWYTGYWAQQRHTPRFEKPGEDDAVQAEALRAAEEAQTEFEEQLAAQEEFEAEQRQLVLGMRACSVC